MNKQLLSTQNMLDVIPKNIFSSLKFIFTISYILLYIVGSAEAETANISTEGIDSLIPLIEKAETECFDNLKVEAHGWAETKSDISDPCELWKKTPESWSCTAYLAGNTGELKRVDVHSLVLKLLKLPGRPYPYSYSKESFSVSYDGEFGKVIRHTKGPLEKPVNEKTGMLLPDPPRRLNVGYMKMFTGEKFTTSRFFDNDQEEQHKVSFSRIFQVATKQEVAETGTFKFMFEEFQGSECLKFGTRGQSSTHETWWLDPSRGFSLIGYERVNIRDGKEKLVKRITVSKLEKVNTNCWWPTEVTLIKCPLLWKGKRISPYKKTVFRASEVVADDPNFDESAFSVPFLEGYKIEDKVEGRTYTVGEK